MKRRLIVIILLVLNIQAWAQSIAMREAFIGMPDSLMPYLSHNNKLDLIDFIESGMKSEVTNELDNRTILEILTPNYLRLRLSRSSLIEMKILPYTVGTLPDSTSHIICMLSTFGEEPAESIAGFYTIKWNPVAVEDPFAGLYNELFAGTDTMKVDNYDILCRIPKMIKASLSPDDETLTVNVSTPMLSTEERTQISSFLREKNLKWDGGKFK